MRFAFKLLPSLRQEEKFFDSRGNVRSITLAPAIHKIEPLEGSGEGGTRITITGRGFSRFGDETEVLIGGDQCEIKELSSHQIICMTIKPSYTWNTNYQTDEERATKFIGGSGARLYFFKKGDANSIEDYVDVDRSTAAATRRWNSGHYEWGSRENNNYIGILEGAFIPPGTVQRGFNQLSF